MPPRPFMRYPFRSCGCRNLPRAKTNAVLHAACFSRKTSRCHVGLMSYGWCFLIMIQLATVTAAAAVTTVTIALPSRCHRAAITLPSQYHRTAVHCSKMDMAKSFIKASRALSRTHHRPQQATWRQEASEAARGMAILLLQQCCCTADRICLSRQKCHQCEALLLLFCLHSSVSVLHKGNVSGAPEQPLRFSVY